jgi:transcriptional regulator with XRE-family HTH domain
MPITFQTPDTLLITIATQAKAQRLAANLTRRTLAEKSGVAEASIKRFETTGQHLVEDVPVIEQGIAVVNLELGILHPVQQHIHPR